VFINSHFKSYDTYNFYHKISQEHTFPLFVTLCVVVGLILCKNVIRRFRDLIARVLKIICCTSDVTVDDLVDHFKDRLSIQFTYKQAFNRGLLRGLATYNILQNPKCFSLFVFSFE